ncbi:MAG: peptidase T [Chitinivibrionales bacterium]|nr:peptidase T [Chitinivibrionales bacterium]
MVFPDILDRFLRYVVIDTQSCEESNSFPSTEKQLTLARLLREELLAIGLSDAVVTSWGYVLATLPTNQRGESVPTIALIAHMDTAMEVSGAGVKPTVHRNYTGTDIVLSDDGGVVLRVSENPSLKAKVGATIVTTDGSTLLGADDKAGIAEIMAAVNYLQQHPEIERPNIRVVFTPDEEVGRGADRITREEIGAHYGYTIDGKDPGDIEDETFCASSIDIDVAGINMHPGYAKGKMVNAVRIASEIIMQFPADRMSPETTEKKQGYIHPNSLTGNVDRCRIKVLVRDFNLDGLAEKEKLVQSIVDAVSKKHPRATITATVVPSYKNMKVVLDQHPLVVSYAEKAIVEAGLKPVRSSIRGGTDGARFCFMGLPCPNLFCAGNNVHSRYEWICAEDMMKASEVIVKCMQLWARHTIA